MDYYNLMKKKAEEKKGTLLVILEVVPVFEPGVFWEYQKHPQEIVDKVDTFLATFAN